MTPRHLLALVALAASAACSGGSSSDVAGGPEPAPLPPDTAPAPGDTTGPPSPTGSGGPVAGGPAGGAPPGRTTTPPAPGPTPPDPGTTPPAPGSTPPDPGTTPPDPGDPGEPPPPSTEVTLFMHGFDAGDHDFVLVNVAEVRVQADGAPVAAEVLSPTVDLVDSFELVPVGRFQLPDGASQVQVEIAFTPEGTREAEQIISSMITAEPVSFEVGGAALAEAGAATVHMSLDGAIVADVLDNVVFHPRFTVTPGRDFGRQRTVVVDDDGVQCPAAPFRTITAAIGEAIDGDRIEVCAGEYREPLRISETLALHGAGPSPSERTADPATEAVLFGVEAIAVDIGDPHVRIEGFTLVGGAGQVGVRTEPDFSGYLVRDNRFFGFDVGVELSTSGSRPSAVTGNVFDTVGTPVIVGSARGNVTIDN